MVTPKHESASATRDDKVNPWYLLLCNWRLLLVVLFGCFGGLLFGYDQGVIGGVSVLDGFRLEFGLTPAVSGQADGAYTTNMISWIVSSFTLGAAASAIFAGPLSDAFSRRWIVLLGALIFTVSGIIQAASVDLVMFFVGRVVGGMAIGILSCVIPIYIAELVSQEVRGIMNTLFQLSITFGILIAFILNLGFQTTYSGWRGSLAMQCFFSLILVIGTVVGLLPESPRWLVINKREDEARAIVKRLRIFKAVDQETAAREVAKAALGSMNKDDLSHLYYDPETQSISLPTVAGKAFVVSARNIQSNIDQEMEEIKTAVAIQEAIGEGTWADMFSLPLRQRVWCGCGIQVFAALSGINAIFYYAPEIFSTVGVSSLQSTAVTGVVNFAATFIALGFIDSVGRVPLLIAGGIGMLISALIVAIVSMAAPASTMAGNAVTVFICLFVVNFAYAWGPCCWIIPAEIFPQTLRGKAVGLTTTVNWLANFAVAQATPHILSGAGVGPTFFMFAGILVFLLIFTILSVPETKGVSLEKMDLIFHVTTFQEWLTFTHNNTVHAFNAFFGFDDYESVRKPKNVTIPEPTEADATAEATIE